MFMGKKKPTKKARLAKAERRNRRIPAFVIIRTKRRILYNIHRRQWRTDKLNFPNNW